MCGTYGLNTKNANDLAIDLSLVGSNLHSSNVEITVFVNSSGIPPKRDPIFEANGDKTEPNFNFAIDLNRMHDNSSWCSVLHTSFADFETKFYT